jgi:hypothetical protein
MEEEHGGAIHNAIVASSTGSTLVYRDAQLVWAARGDQVPVCLCVASFAHLHGLVTQLDADGTLAVTYMGTDPPLNVVGGLDGKELNYEEMDDEHRRLLAVIRDATSETKVQPTDKVVLRCQVCTPVRLRLRTKTSDLCELSDSADPSVATSMRFSGAVAAGHARYVRRRREEGRRGDAAHLLQLRRHRQRR